MTVQHQREFVAHLVDEHGFLVPDEVLGEVERYLADDALEAVWDLVGAELSEIVIARVGALDYTTDHGGVRMPASYRCTDVPFTRDLDSEDGNEILTYWRAARALCSVADG